jgi:hypothetical protein
MMEEKFGVIYEYDTSVYNWKQLLENLLKCSLENLHLKYVSEDAWNWVSDVQPKSTYGDLIHTIYSYFRNDADFNLLWKSFCENILKLALNVSPGEFTMLNKNVIVMQRLPSIKIVPSKSTVKYCDNDLINKNGIDYSLHTDNEIALHPEFEENFWMPLMDVDDHNTLYILHSDNILYPVNIKYGQFVKFYGCKILHGSIPHNSSINTRISFDFRGCSYSNYNEEILTDGLLKSAGKVWRQKDYYNINNYYRLI